MRFACCITKSTNKHSEYCKKNFNSNNSKTNEPQRYVCYHISYTWSKFEPKLNYQLLKLTPDPIPSTLLQVRENRIRNFGHLNRKWKSSYLNNNSLYFGSLNSPEVCHKFRVLTGYRYLVRAQAFPNDFEDDFKCVVITYGPPEGNTTSIFKQAYTRNIR
jgi:hypothetical protein